MKLLIPLTAIFVRAEECSDDLSLFPGTCQAEAAANGMSLVEFLSAPDCSDYDEFYNLDTCEVGCCAEFGRNGPGRKGANKNSRSFNSIGYSGALVDAKLTDTEHTRGESVYVELNRAIADAKKNVRQSKNGLVDGKTNDFWQKAQKRLIKQKLLGLMVLYIAHDDFHDPIENPDFFDQVSSTQVINNGWPTFASFVSYGCWCFQNDGDDLPNFTAGNGQAIDILDRACRKRALCAKCATYESYNDVCQQDEGYKFVSSTVNGERVISCENEDNTCAKNNCLCDIEFAKEAAAAFRNFPTAEQQYQPHASERMTGYVPGSAIPREEKCIPVTAAPPQVEVPQAPPAEETTAQEDLFHQPASSEDNETSLVGSLSDTVADLISQAGSTDTDSSRPRPSNPQGVPAAQLTTNSRPQSSGSNPAPSTPVNSSPQLESSDEETSPVAPAPQDPAPSDSQYFDYSLSDADFDSAEEVEADSEFTMAYDDNYLSDTDFSFVDDYYNSFTESASDTETSDYADLIYTDVLDAVTSSDTDLVTQIDLPAATALETDLHHHNYLTADDLDTRHCCGDFPNRFPIKISQTQECCSSTGMGYNPNTHLCCPGGASRSDEVAGQC